MLHQSSMSVAALLLVSFVVSPCQSKLLLRRPENHVGKILLSSDDSHPDYNTDRLMVFFDYECINSLTTDELASIYSKQASTVSSIINNHYPCLSPSLDHRGNSQHFQFSSHNSAVSFLDIDNTDESCLLHSSDTSYISDGSRNPFHSFHTSSNSFPSVLDPIKMSPLTQSSISSKSKSSLNYTAHCINYITYEPTFNLDSSMNMSDIIDCEMISTNNETQWQLDESDSIILDGYYSYPNINGNGDNVDVDLYILDSGIRSTHEEFYSGQVIHAMGDGYAYYEEEDWYASHGTHVADIAGGINYGRSKGLNIYDYRVCEFPDIIPSYVNSSYNPSCYFSLILSALEEINKNLTSSGRRGVINLSLSGSKSIYDYVYEYHFKQIRQNGGIVVVAAGNTGTYGCDNAPGYSFDAITVGATDRYYQATWFSAWGECVDVWAPGLSIYAALSENDTAYDYMSGTSMASPAIAGTIANLLIQDPTLSFYEIKTILSSNSISITGNKCNDFECIYPLYNCSILPAEYYSGSLEPTTSETQIYMVYDGVPDYDLCNYFALIEIDPIYENTDNYNNYFVRSVTYTATDKCIATRESDFSEYSYSIECITNTSANLIVWDNTNCEGDGSIVKTLNSGEVIDDDWYIVDCDNYYDLLFENTTGYDNSDCDIVARFYQLDEDETCDDVSEDSTKFVDFADIFGGCNVVRNATTGFVYSYEYLCNQNETYGSYLYVLYYFNDICNGTAWDSYIWYEGCYEDDGLAVEILECGIVDLFFERNNITYKYSYFELDSDDVTAGTWILIWSAMALALICCCIAICIVFVTFETFWQRENCHCPFRIPLVSPHSSLSKSKIATMNDNIEPIFRYLTTFIVCVYAGSLLFVTIGQCIQNSAIADYAANNWNYEKSIEDAYNTGSDMAQYSFYVWIYCKLPLYILFISRLWYVFKDTKYQYPKQIFYGFGVALIAQTYLATQWLYIGKVIISGFWDVVFLIYSFCDILIIGFCVWLFVRRLTSLAVSQSVERSLETGEISVVNAPSSVGSSGSEKSWRKLNQINNPQTNIRAVSDETGTNTPNGGSSPVPGKGARGARGTATSVVSVRSVTNVNAISLDKRQLKLIFEITRYTLLTLVAMLSTFTLGFVICYCYYKQNQYPDKGCSINCLITTYAAQSFAQAIDCFINVMAIHLNSGFQKKNYEILCKHPHNLFEVCIVKRTKQKIITKTNKKLNQDIDGNDISGAGSGDEGDNDGGEPVDTLEVRGGAGSNRKAEAEMTITPSASTGMVGTADNKKPPENKRVISSAQDWEFD